MKRSIFLILLFTLFIIKAQSQSFHAGFMLGPAITDIDGADLTDNDNDFHKLGFSIGGLVNQKIGKHALAQMELAFIQKGSSQPVNLDSSGRYLFVPYTINLNYLDVSLLVKQGLGYSKKANYDKFGVEFGLTMGNLVGSSFKDSSNMLIKGLTSINKFDLELLAGVYYNFTPGFFLDVRYSNSIIHAIKHDAGFVNVYPYFTFQKGNNMVFQITLGFEFGNKKKE